MSGQVLLFSKSAYSVTVDGHRIPGVIAGHTAQLVRSIVRAFSNTHFVHVFPSRAGEGDITVWDEHDPPPGNVTSVPVGLSKHEKMGHALDAIEVAGVIRTHADDLRSALFVYPFPAILMSWRILREHPLAMAALFRGGDAYKWLDAEHLMRVFGQASEGIRVEYQAALNTCFLKLAASEWLKSVAEHNGVHCDGTLPSPPPDLEGIQLSGILDRSEAKQTLLERLDPRFVRVKPDSHRCWLVWSGRLHADKNVSLAIDAFLKAELKGWQLVIAGPGSRSIPAVALGKVAHIVVPPRLLNHLYAAADALIHTSVPSASFIDARPSAVTAATAYGVPTVALFDRRRGGVQESLSDHNVEALCVDITDGLSPDTSTHLAARLRRLSNADLLRDVSTQCSLVRFPDIKEILASVMLDRHKQEMSDDGSD